MLVTPITFRHPAVIAKTAATLDQMSGGRFDLGVGTGWMEAEHEAFGLPFPEWSERFDLPSPEKGARYLPRLWAKARIDAWLERHPDVPKKRSSRRL